MSLFELLEALHQFIIFTIRDLRHVLDVIEFVMPSNLVA
jgi:hypothetical protein